MGRHSSPAHPDNPWWSPDPLLVAVFIIGVLTLTTVVCTLVITLHGDEAPEGLLAIGAGGAGSLGTFLARGGRN